MLAMRSFSSTTQLYWNVVWASASFNEEELHHIGPYNFLTLLPLQRNDTIGKTCTTLHYEKPNNKLRGIIKERRATTRFTVCKEIVTVRRLRCHVLVVGFFVIKGAACFTKCVILQRNLITSALTTIGNRTP
jgi:hypothetical protein